MCVNMASVYYCCLLFIYLFNSLYQGAEDHVSITRFITCDKWGIKGIVVTLFYFSENSFFLDLNVIINLFEH